MTQHSLVLRCARYALLAIGTPLAAHAQTVYLRTPGTGFCKVTGATNATPIRLSVANIALCGINANGQIVVVTEVRGNTAANIHLENASDTVNLARMVATLSNNTFELLDLAGNPVAANGAYINGGRVGLATAHTLRAHPRLYLDGPAGPITASVSSTAANGRANPGNLPFTALKNSIPAWGTIWGSDRTGAHAAGAALRWLADGDATARTKALASLTNITQVLGTPACDEAERGCLAPPTTVQDYPTQFMEQFSQAYSIMHGEMTAGDRTNFAEFALNDLPWTQGGLGYTGTALVKPTYKPVTGTVAASGTSVTGTGTQFLTQIAVGDIIVMPVPNSYAGTYPVASIESDTALTLALPIDSASVPPGSGYQVGPAWNNTMYGLTWHSKHFDAALMCGGATATYPEAIFADCQSNYGLNAGLDQSGTHNLVLARLQGYYSMGLAACGDDPRGCLLLSLANEWFADVALPRALTVWTGFSQSNSSYHSARMYNSVTSIAAMTMTSFAEQPDYLANTRMVANGSLWGVGAAVPAFNFYIPSGEQSVFEIVPTIQRSVLLMQFMAPASIEARYYKDWQTNRITYDESYLRYNNGEYTWYEFLYNDPVTTPLTAPTTLHFAATDRARCVAIYGAALCPSGEGRYMSISRQNWDIDATYAGLNLTSYRCLDHCADDIGAWLFIAKNGAVMMAGDSNNYMSSRAGRGYVELGGTSDNLRTFPETGPVTFHWTAGDDSFMVSNAGLTGTFKTAANASSVSRQVIHLKSGSQDYLIDHVRAAASAPTSIRGLQHFHLNGCGTPSAASCIAMDRASATVTNTQPGAKLLSKALGIGGSILIDTETGSESDGSYTGGEGKTFRWAVCPANGASCDTAATSAEWAVVHKLSNSSGATLPPLVQGSAGPFRIVEIQDPVSAKVALFTVDGATATSASFTTSHAGAAQYVVSGLEAGPYSISRDGAPVGLRQAAAGGNSITFESEAGSISIVPGPPPLTIVTSSLPNAAQGKPYSATVSAISSTTPYSWQLVAGTLCSGLSLSQAGDQAVIGGSATTLGTCTFTLEVTNSTSTEADSKVFSITVVEAGPQVAVATTALPVGRVGDSYVGTLQATGGTLPLAWSVVAGSLCPGLALDSLTGRIGGAPTQTGVCGITVRVTDVGNEFAERELFIAVVENQQAVLFINRVRASHSGAAVHFGRRGLDFAAACSLVLRLDGASGTVLSTLSSASGHGRRALVANGLPSGQNIHAAATCGADSAEAQFNTGFAPTAPRPLKLLFHPPEHTPAAVADILLSYGDSPSLPNTLVVPCAGGSCVATLVTDEPILYWRGDYRDSSGNVLASSGLHRIAPR